MHGIGVLLLVAATSTGGLFGKAHVGGARLTRSGVVAHGPAPAGGPMAGAAMMGAQGCPMGEPGCNGGPGCKAAGMSGMGGPGGPGGAGGQGGQGTRRFPNVRSQVYFVEPTSMKIGWQTAAAGPSGMEKVYLPAQLTVPARYNFTQGYIYRLKLTDIQGQAPGLTLYPTIEVAPSTPATDAYLTHNPIPAIFTAEDFDNVVAGNFVTKVIYLPDPKYQELAVSGVETLVSNKLEPGVDPILEADRRGTILMIIRLGAIDLEMPTTSGGITMPMTTPTTTAPAVTPVPAPAPLEVPVTPNTGGMMIPQPGAAPAPENVPVDPMPAAPVPSPEPPAAPADAPADAPKPGDMPLGGLEAPRF